MPTRYSHTNVVARDPERLARFYSDVLDCPQVAERRLEGAWLSHCERNRWLVRKPTEHHVRHALELSAYGGVERWMPVAVDGAPPRSHAVDQLAAVCQP